MASDASQGRLFDPGPKGPDRWALHPDKWLQRSDVVYHASNAARLPRHDRGGNLDVGYGDSVGMHFGDKATAIERAVLTNRDNVHAVRLNSKQFTEILPDHAANYGDDAGRVVREGGVVRYRNDYENPGAISYRAKPEATKTWSQDVTDDPNAHPALQRLAATGYNPVIQTNSVVNAPKPPVQDQLFAADVVAGGRSVSHHVNEDDAFEAADALNAKKRSAGGYGNAGVKRNNIQQGGGWLNDAKKATPRLRRARELKPDPYED